MAVTKLHSISDSVCGSLEYIVDGNKTRNHTLVESFMCETEPVKAAAEFRAVKKRIGSGRSTTKAQHIIQSFAPGEITPEKAMEIAQELCHRLLKEQYLSDFQKQIRRYLKRHRRTGNLYQSMNTPDIYTDSERNYYK